MWKHKDGEISVATMWSEHTCVLIEVQWKDATWSNVNESATESDEDNANGAALDLIWKLNNAFQLDLKWCDLSYWSETSLQTIDSRRKRIMWKVNRGMLDKTHMMTINESLSNISSAIHKAF